MKTELSKLRDQLENKRDSRGRVPAIMKLAALLIVERARQNGMSYRAISKQIGKKKAQGIYKTDDRFHRLNLLFMLLKYPPLPLRSGKPNLSVAWYWNTH